MISIFFHVAVMNHYASIYEETMNIIYNCGLIDLVDSINIGISGGDRTTLPFITEKVNILHENVNLKKYELPTLIKLQEHAQRFPGGKTLYIHTKNASRSVDDKDSDKFTTKLGWWSREVHRHYMQHFIIKKYSSNLRLLDNNIDCVGVDFRNQPENSSHFAGNFWWSKNSHLIKLPDLKKPMFKISGPFGQHPRHYCERWLLCYNNKENNFTPPKFKCLFWGKILRSQLDTSMLTTNLDEQQRFDYFEHLEQEQRDGKLKITI